MKYVYCVVHFSYDCKYRSIISAMQNNLIWRTSNESSNVLIENHYYNGITKNFWPVSARKQCAVFLEIDKKLVDYTAQDIALHLLENLDLEYCDDSILKDSTVDKIIKIDEYLLELVVAFNYTCAKYNQHLYQLYNIFNTLQSGHFRDIKRIIIDYVNSYPYLSWAEQVADFALKRLNCMKPIRYETINPIFGDASTVSANLLIKMITQMPICGKAVCIECLLGRLHFV